ncbi:TetR/AcrR family transcriptional regulator C-terminal domain-containing protein [Pseudomonas sp. NPDC089918]|uniref:TetR/AcrR family transcriptional regulator C-terminal domain-containing protein n=1 Tax=Pseudomonas sp. NPDC089918 TaxID=3390654 RepID=UPI003CFDD04D
MARKTSEETKSQATTETKKVRAVSAKTITAKTGRGRGRPTGTDTSLLDKKTIIAVALQLTKMAPLQDVSIVKVAKELGVTPALIHYYLGGRDPLTSGVMNMFYKELVESWPPEQGGWRHNIEVTAEAMYRAYIRYPGVAAYVISHNRYRLFQEVAEGETDYGVIVFEKMLSTVRGMGFDAARTSMYAHLIVDFIIGNAHATVRHRWPGEHKEFLDAKLAALDPKVFPAVDFVRESYTTLNALTTFAAGLNLLFDALELALNRMNLGNTLPLVDTHITSEAPVAIKRPARSRKASA